MNGDDQVNLSGLVQDAAVVDGLRPIAADSGTAVPADEWDQGDETPRPAQGLLGAMGSGGGMVRSRGTMPIQMAFETPSSQQLESTNSKTTGHPGVQDE